MTDQSIISKLTDVLMFLNPDLDRHAAFARATRIIDFTRRGDLGMEGYTPEYVGKLFAGALTGARRAQGKFPRDVGTGEE